MPANTADATSREPARPAQAHVAAVYDRGVEGYVNRWSAVILPASQSVVAAMQLEPAATVIDVGAGSGAVVPAVRRASPAGTVVAVDASLEMLRVARADTEAFVVHADGLRLPVADRSAAAVLLAFVLFHMASPPDALAEARRVLRAGGKIGTATWAASEMTPRAYEVWDRTLTDAGAPPIEGGRVDAGLDSPSEIRSLLTEAGFTPTRVWVEHLRHQWTPDTYFQLATGSGLNRRRLDVLDEATRVDAIELARMRLSGLEAPDLVWSGGVVCAVATATSAAPS
jgi:SAM-dependent methyltransferase